MCVCVCVYFNNKERVVLVVKNLPANAGDIRNTGLIPGGGRSPGGEHGNTHSSILYWRIPWIEDPIGSQWVRYDWSDFAFMHNLLFIFTSLLDSNFFIQFSSITQSCLTLCNPINRSTPGLPVHHQLLELTQTHVHQVGDAIQPSHPLLSPSSPAPNPSQHQGLFQWVNSSLEVAKILEFQLQHQSFQLTPRTDLL